MRLQWTVDGSTEGPYLSLDFFLFLKAVSFIYCSSAVDIWHATSSFILQLPQIFLMGTLHSMLQYAKSANSSLGITWSLQKNIILCLLTVIFSIFLWIQLKKWEQIMLSGRLLIRKCLKGQFKIVSFLSCLLCVDTTLVHPFSYIALLFNCENSTKTGLKMSIKQLMSKENSQRPSKSSKNVFPRKN